MDNTIRILKKELDPIEVAADKCDLCGSCVGVCPPDCIILNEHSLVVDGALCIRCGLCLTVCPVGALSWWDGHVRLNSVVFKAGADGR